MLEDAAWEPIGRHEATEALAAIGGEGVAEVLTNTARTQSQRCGGHLIFTRYLHLHNYFQVRETCQLALDMMEFRRNNKHMDANMYGSVDPAPASTEADTDKLKTNLLNTDLSLFER